MQALQQGSAGLLLASSHSSLTAGAACVLGRCFSVLSWGRNIEGQCGVETPVLVPRPTPILELQGTDLQSLACSREASAAVSADGEVYTWGCGRGGKLGHGNSDSTHFPVLVESLFGNAISHVSLGERHSLFLDRQGALYACGENKEGQCGLGTPLEVLARQHRKAFNNAFKSVRDAAALGGMQMSSAQQRASRSEQTVRQYIRGLMNAPGASHQSASYQAGWAGMQHTATSRTTSWHHASSATSSAHGPSSDGARLALGFNGFDQEAHFKRAGLEPGQHPTPMRLGRDAHPLMEWYHRNDSQIPDLVPNVSGLGDEVVVGLSASRYFSAAVTAWREVWTWGACYNGALGSSSSWSTSAERVTGPLAQTLDELGGAVAVAAGGTFCLALTTAGKAVVWGKVHGGSKGPQMGGGVLSVSNGAITMSRDGQRTLAGVVLGLPHLTHVAAGHQHALLSDGQSVWSIGRWMGRDGEEVGSAHWSEPKEVLVLPPGDSIKALVCGPHCSAVVTHMGELYMWGRLLDRHQVDGMVRRYMQHRDVEAIMDGVDLRWPGFGADFPTRVTGLSGPVRAVGLGGWHAVVQID